MICSSTSKFAGYDDHECEIDSSDISSTAYTATVRAYRPCAECGSAAAEAYFEFELPIDHACEDATFEIEEEKAEPSERYESVNAKGKAIMPRYQKRFLGVDLTVTISCDKCNETIVLTGSDECQASHFESTEHYSKDLQEAVEAARNKRDAYLRLYGVYSDREQGWNEASAYIFRLSGSSFIDGHDDRAVVYRNLARTMLDSDEVKALRAKHNELSTRYNVEEQRLERTEKAAEHHHLQQSIKAVNPT